MSDVIVVRYESEVLGNGVFWTGTQDDIPSIRNVVARRLAALVSQDGKPRADGMWRAALKEER
jgi:hypothetical protein